MNILFFAIVIPVLILLILLVIILIKKNNSKSTTVKTNTTSIQKDEEPKTMCSDLKLPNRVEKFDNHTLFQACNKIFDTFKALDYASKQESFLDKKEWHTWQVSLLLRTVKIKYNFYVPTQKGTFHPSLENQPNENILGLMKRIESKYLNQVNVDRNKDELCNEIIWTSRDVSVIFYYLINRNNFKE
ncbi:hypothetical protein [Poseidonibacter lekithochrous]|uniref:hypothetical protein n=1 Tax=Poseidonibacter lekithochrous TaxID=1904463 RepID=UPI000D365B5E|nr:hypothetical protein [Poseidonibacter lekithochrous]